HGYSAGRGGGAARRRDPGPGADRKTGRRRHHVGRRIDRRAGRSSGHGTIDMNAIAAPSDRRFRRAHLKPGRRRRAWRALVRPLLRYGVLGAVLAYGVYRLSAAAAHARVLRIEYIDVVGNERLSKGEVL